MINFNPGAQNIKPENQGHRCNLNLQAHLDYVDTLVLAGIIDENTGKSIKQNMTATFAAKNGVSAPLLGDNNGINFDESEFLKARSCLLDYLKGHDLNLDARDMKEIEAVILALEAAAVEKEAKKTGENTLKLINDTNEIAKERLVSGSLAGQGTKNIPGKLFTRDEIAKMSTAEFIKNEPVINYQLQNGLI